MNLPEVKPKSKEDVTGTKSRGRNDRLAPIVAVKRGEVAALYNQRERLREAARGAAPTRGFAAALRSPAEVRLLAEIKNRSPSAGVIREGADPVDVARAYESGGAAALSVLTDERFFGGSIEALRRVRDAVNLPLLRKDFIIDPVQIWEARSAGADAILLIVRILTDDQLRDLHEEARACDMDVLVEIHDPTELDRALAIGATLIGVNNRDLSTFRTDLAMSLEVAPTIESGVTLVAESGIRTKEDVQRLGAVGVDAILVGESLMRQPDLREAAAALVGQPRSDHVRSAVL